MAQLKSLLVNGSSRFIGDSFANKIELTSISAPTSSGGTTYGLGSNGQVLKSNGSSVYWTSLGTMATETASNYILKSTLSGAFDIMYSSAANTPTRLAANTTSTKKFLRMTGTGSAGAAPTWDTVTKTDVGLSNVENTKLSTWAGSSNITTIGTLSSGTVPWARLSNVPSASTSTAGIIQIGTGATNAAAGNHTHTTSLATDTGTATVTLAHNTTYKLTAGGTSVIFKMPSDNNTDTKVMQGTTTTGSWRKILLNGGSDTVYSAWDTAVGNDVTDITYRTFGVAVQPSTNTLKATNLEADKTIKVGTFTIGGNTDELTKTISSSSTIYVDRTNASVIFKYNGTNKIRIDTNNYLRPEADNTLQLGDSSYRWNKIYGTNIYGALIGNVTGNVSGSSSSCTGNAATATEFSSNATVKLTGDVTGETSAKKGWAVATTLASVTRTNNTSTASPSHGGNFTVIDSITTDTKGRVTAVNTKTVTLPSDNNTWNALSTSQAGYVSQAPNNTTKFLRGDATWAQVSEASLTWGGQNFSGNYGCIDAAMVDTLGANRLMFLKPAGISIKYTRDGGSTWTDYGATNTQKRGLFAAGYNFVIGKADSTNKATANGTNYQLEVVIDTGAASVYTALNKFVIYISTNGSNNCTVTIQKALQSTPSTYIDVATNIPISGWSGYNVINVGSITTYGNTASSQYGRIRFLFKANGGSTSYNGLTITQIMGFGGVGWTTPSTMAKTGHLYSYDNDLNATFPAKVTATSFSGNADSATKATQDESGNNIKASYASSFSISDHTITLKNKNGESLGSVTVPDNNTTYTFASGNGSFTVTPSGGSTQTVSIGKPATAGTADSATNVAWSGVTSKPTVASPTADGTEISFIDTVKQDSGTISATRKTVRNATFNQSGIITTEAQSIAGKKTLRYSYRIYPLVGASNEKSKWYKIIFPYSTATTTSSAKWFMNSFDLHFGGGYSSNATGVAHVTFYWSRAQQNGAWTATQVSAFLEGVYINKINMYYRIAEPGILYVNNSSNNYNGIWLDNLYVDDTAPNLDWSTTTIETCAAITDSTNPALSAYTVVPSTKIYTEDGTTLKTNVNFEGNHIKGTQLYTSAATAKTSTSKLATIESDNYIYYITPANALKSAIGTTSIGNSTTPIYWDGTGFAKGTTLGTAAYKNASGTWNISITGTAVAANAANLINTTKNAIVKYNDTMGAFANSGVLIDGSNNLYPNTTNSSLGSTTNSWKNIYITQSGGANTSQGLQYVNTSGTLLSKIMVNSSNNLIIQVPEDKQIVARNSLTASDKGLILTRDQLEFYNVSTLKMSDGNANAKSVSLIFNTTTNALNFVFA